MRATRCAPTNRSRADFIFSASARAPCGSSICSSGPLCFWTPSGLVVQDREIVTPPFDGQVLSFTARPGQKVAAGQQLGNVVSTQMLDLISSLVTRNAQFEARQTQIAARLAAIETTLPAAENRARTAKAAQATIEKAFAGGFSTRVREAETSPRHLRRRARTRILAFGTQRPRKRKRRGEIEFLASHGRA